MLERDPTRFSDSLHGKTVIIAITASISIYRLPDIIRDIRREGANVIIGMSKEAIEMISPEVMKWASGNEVITKITGEIEHISRFIGSPGETMLLVCPASYNFIGKAASGISDDVPSLFFSFALGNGNPVVISPVMHEGMMINPVNKENLKKLEKFGVLVVPPRLEAQKAKISESDKIIDYVSRAFDGNPLKDRKILIIGGRGEERIDPVRNITNSGTGLTASWLLRSAFRFGASRISYVGNTQYSLPDYVDYHPAKFMNEFEESVIKLLEKEKLDVVVNVASLPDFELKDKFLDKIDSSSKLDLHLVPRKKLNVLIRSYHKGFLAIFKLSKESTADEVRASFRDIEPDMVIFNPYSEKSLPFGSVSNRYMCVMRKTDMDLGSLSKPEMTAQMLTLISKALR